MSKLALPIVSIVLLASAAVAHPGHGEAGQGLTAAHHLTEPVHILAAVTLLVIACAGAALMRARRTSTQRVKE